MASVMIGVDPHKLSATIEVVDEAETVLATGRFGTDKAGYAAMRERGGAFVVITPVVGMSGAAELGPYSAAVEGVRLLAKSAARQWGVRTGTRAEERARVRYAARSRCRLTLQPRAARPCRAAPAASRYS